MHLKSLIHLSRLLIVIPAMVLPGCFGGGSGPAPIPATALVGVLVNLPVEGASFTTATQSGVTNADGEFRYYPGEMVTFKVGGIELGTVLAAPFITPVELTGSADPTAPAANNQMVFLQSIDADQSSGGITISAATEAAATGLMLDFTDLAEVQTVAGMIAPQGNTVVTEQDALDNFYQTYVILGGSNTFSWPFPGYPAFPSGDVELLTNGGFNDPDAFFADQNIQTGWTLFAGSFAVEDLNVFGNFGPVSHDGDGQSLKLFGNDGGAFQVIDATPGSTYNASVWAMNWTGNGTTDPFGEFGFMELSFRDAGGNVLAASQVFVDPLDDGINTYLAPQDGADVSDWTQLATSLVAPANTTTAQILVIHQLVGADTVPGGGTLRFDDASLTGPPALVWSDEFERGTQLDTTIWTVETGASGWGNNEWQEYTGLAANISIDPDPNNANNGHLRISALLDTAQCPSPAPLVCGFQDGTITSARITTNPDMMPNQGFAFKYGRIEASIKLPLDGYGTWPAFWMLGENFPIVGWPKTGEIDIVEMFNTGGTSNREALFTMHWCDESLGVGCAFPAGYATTTSSASLGEPLGNAFRVYSAEWNASGVTWKVDGVTYKSTVIQPATMEEFLENFFIILNVAIGGNPFGGIGTPASAPDATGWPRTMLVDWVRVYQ